MTAGLDDRQPRSVDRALANRAAVNAPPTEAGLRADLCALVLAGGRSRRMGRNKALLEHEGETLAGRLVRLCRRLTDDVLISANEPAAFAALAVPVIPDLIRGSGPMAGIHAAMIRTSRPLLLVVACDMPRIPLSTLLLIVSSHSRHAITAPRTRDGRAHPLCAVYDRTLLPDIERRLKAGENRLLDLLSDSDTHWVETGFSESDFANWNCPEDLWC